MLGYFYLSWRFFIYLTIQYGIFYVFIWDVSFYLGDFQMIDIFLYHDGMSLSILEIPSLLIFPLWEVPFYLGDSQLIDCSSLVCPFLPWRFPGY